jgi:RsiW-degrading membrane proteinase PrsW (M82 family)
VTLFDRLLAVTGIIPPFVLLWYAERFERRIREPTRGWRYRIVAASGLISVPIAWVERVLGQQLEATPQPLATLFDSFVNAALVEELGKLACLLLLTRGLLAPRTRYGAFVYALHASMGFALVENVLAMLKVPDLVTFSTRFFLRAYMTVPMHLVAGGILGYLWSRNVFDRARAGLKTGLLVAVLVHGSFNAALLAVEALPPDRDVLRVACAVLAMAIPLVGTLVLRLLAGHLRGLDRVDETYARRRGTAPTAAEARS